MLRKVVIVGVGLIGGSFALALKAANAARHIVGVGRHAEAMARALELGIVDAVAPSMEDAMRDADLVLIAAPVAQTAAILQSLLPYLDERTVVTDAGSTKSDVVAAARAVLGDRIGQFVPGHPIAGRETNGPDAALASLYGGKKVVLTPLPENSQAGIGRVSDAWSACGAIMHTLSPEEHDRVFAAVSHLPHLLAYALVDDIANKPHAGLLFQYAASGFRDFTRIAGSSPEMWRDISLANREALLGELDAYLAQLTTMRAMLAAQDAQGLEGIYANARDARERWISAIEGKGTVPTGLSPDFKEHNESPGTDCRLGAEGQSPNTNTAMTERLHHLDLAPVHKVQGVVRLPGSKSISNRTLLLAALSHGSTAILDLLESDDTHVMLEALRALGIGWERVDERTHLVHGAGGVLPNASADLFMGNAGTAIRPLTAALAVIGGDYTLHGVPRMHERPIGDLVDALNAIGADIEYAGQPGYPPLHIKRGAFADVPIQVRGNVSSQFLTALLMSAPLMAAGRDVRIEVVGELISRPYIEITLNLMRRFGVSVAQEGWQAFTVRQGARYASPGTIHVEGDASSASYFLAAGAIAGGPVRVQGVGSESIQGDVRFAEALEAMGATITRGDDWIEASSNGPLKAIDMDFNHIPDAAMTIAVAALYADGTTTLRNIASWRVKETDRIAAMAAELRKLGAEVEEGADYLRVTPPERILPATIDTYDDHRMAMCFSLASLDGALRKGAQQRINDPGCVAKTFPDYFAAFASIAV